MAANLGNDFTMTRMETTFKLLTPEILLESNKSRQNDHHGILEFRAPMIKESTLKVMLLQKKINQ